MCVRSGEQTASHMPYFWSANLRQGVWGHDHFTAEPNPNRYNGLRDITDFTRGCARTVPARPQLPPPRYPPGGRHLLSGCSLHFRLRSPHLAPGRAPALPWDYFGSTAGCAPEQAIGCPVSGRGSRTIKRFHWQAQIDALAGRLFGAGAVVAERCRRAVLRLRSNP